MNNQNTPIDLNAVHKHFCQNIAIVTTNDAFFMMVDTGDAKTTYALTPEHMKRLSQSIAYNVSEFEKKHRKIDAEWSPGIQSPIQSKDLESPNGKGNRGQKKK